MKRLTKWILWIFGISAGLILVFYILLYYYKIPIIIPIKESAELHFTNEYDKDALLMIPAAYTNEDGTIQGEYRIDGKIYGTPLARKEYRFIRQEGLSYLAAGTLTTVSSRLYL